MATLFPSPAPTLPEFRSLLIEGPFHPSAPIHLMLSHVALEPSRRALMLSPSRKDFASALINFDDEWLKIHGSEGRTCGASSRVDILYPPTRAHLALILSMLHVHDGSFYHPKTTLSVVPSLLVLHETSTLCADETSGPTLAAYLSLVSHALSVAAALSATSSTKVSVAVFDTGLSHLKLPVLRPPSPDPEEDAEAQPADKRERVSLPVEKYFEWVGIVETVISSDDVVQDTDDELRSTRGNMRIVLRRPQDIFGSAASTEWRWVVATRLAGPSAGGKYFTFLS